MIGTEDFEIVLETASQLEAIADRYTVLLILGFVDLDVVIGCKASQEPGLQYVEDVSCLGACFLIDSCILFLHKSFRGDLLDCDFAGNRNDVSGHFPCPWYVGVLLRLPGKAGVVVNANVVPAGLGCFLFLFAEINTLIELIPLGRRTETSV